ncbi:MAG TPA: hypothetical protein DDY24_10065 [Alcaligenaceae bacterium]|nr:hypothetical protein [Alcaligenaceae bacterium]
MDRQEIRQCTLSLTRFETACIPSAPCACLTLAEAVYAVVAWRMPQQIERALKDACNALVG